MLIKNQTIIELSEQELEVVAGGADESFAPNPLPPGNIFKQLPEIKFPNSWDGTIPNPFPPTGGDVVYYSNSNG
ncbi:hypothetical protein BV378_33770 [Nostoc sp. RF31YmG]|nr:hypothetical protein BV378_33770 [Nostoc sp. RF31YmG]